MVVRVRGADSRSGQAQCQETGRLISGGGVGDGGTRKGARIPGCDDGRKSGSRRITRSGSPSAQERTGPHRERFAASIAASDLGGSCRYPVGVEEGAPKRRSTVGGNRGA